MSMRRPQGWAIITDPDARVPVEFDTRTCGHCNRIDHIPAGTRAEDLGGLCRICMTLICPRCHAKGTCDPLEEKLSRAEASYEARRSYGLA